jgi:hypothetical protein
MTAVMVDEWQGVEAGRRKIGLQPRESSHIEKALRFMRGVIIAMKGRQSESILR